MKGKVIACSLHLEVVIGIVILSLEKYGFHLVFIKMPE